MFRIERIDRGTGEATSDNGSEGVRHREIMLTLAELKASLNGDEGPSAEDAELLKNYQAELERTQKIRDELDQIKKAILETKREIATLHHTGFNEQQMGNISDELDAVVGHTEQATDSILAAVETIVEDANNLIAALSGHEHDLAADIQEQVVKILESCNFQDITGQRITKIINTLKFVEQHVNQMLQIWGGLDEFKDLAPYEMEPHHKTDDLTRGPSNEDDPTTASQDDIDALFS